MKISKAQLLSGKKCEKALWFQIHAREQNKENNNPLKFEIEDWVVECAFNLFPQGKRINGRGKTRHEVIEDSKKAIKQNNNIIFNTGFETKGVFFTCDVLEFSHEGNKLYAIKSSNRVKAEHIEEVAYEKFLLKQIGISIEKVFVIYINADYERSSELNYNDLFNIEEVTEYTCKFQEDYRYIMKSLSACRKEGKVPCKPLGEYCLKPYACEFKSICWRHVPQNSIFDITSLPLDLKFKYFNDGIISFEQAMGRVKLNDNQKMQILCELKDEEFIDRDKIRNFLNEIKYPLYFLDFETFSSPIPQFEKVRPYEQIPFLYSLHTIESPEGELKHNYFIASIGKDPRRPLAESLINNISTKGSVIVYNKSLEKTVIKDLALQFQDLSSSLMKIRENIKDMMIIFQRRYYYVRAMKGSHSIKNVLPALFPNEPKLNYESLNIKNGEMANNIYTLLWLKSKEEQNNIKKELVKYCSLDSYAMVKIFERLKESCSL